MTLTERASFRLERLEWSAPDRIEIAGRWQGMPDDELSAPVLVVRGSDEHLRVPSLWKPKDARPARGLWEATFVWPYDPAWVRDATLELDNGTVVELPPVGARRFSRTVLRVRHVEHSDGATSAYDRLREHTAAAIGREDVEAAREEARQAHQEAERARQDLMSERDRAKAESARMRDALMTAETLAARVSREKDAVNQLLKIELADVGAALAAEQERATEADRRREELQAQLERAQHTLARLGGDLEAMRSASEAAGAERDAAVRELQQLREGLQAEHIREVASLRERVQSAERAAAEESAARAELDRAVQEARSHSEVLSARLAAVRQAIASDLGAD